MSPGEREPGVRARQPARAVALGPALMCHLVAGFPDQAGSLAVARGLAEGGASYLEIQFPYSDPMADGPAIQEACARALAGGFTVDRGFELVAAARWLPRYIMSYAGLVVARGPERFAREAAAAGASGLIVPDLPFDDDEGLAAACRSAGIESVAVAAPVMSPARLAALLARRPRSIYAALRPGITGARTALDSASFAFLDRLGSGVDSGAGCVNSLGGDAGISGGADIADSGVAGTGCGAAEEGSGIPRIFAGFGIGSAAQVRVLAGRAHAVVAGSYFIRRLLDAGPIDAEAARELSRLAAAELLDPGRVSAYAGRRRS